MLLQRRWDARANYDRSTLGHFDNRFPYGSTEYESYEEFAINFRRELLRKTRDNQNNEGD